MAEFPLVVAIAVMGLQGPLGGRPNRLRLTQGTPRDALLHLLQAFARPLHGLCPLGLLVLPPLLRIDDKHPLLFISRVHFLHPRAQGLLPLAGVDAPTTIEPLRFIHLLEPNVDLSMAQAAQAHQVAMTV